MTLDPARLFYALVLSTIIGGLAYWRRSLTLGGWLGAVLTGTCTCGLGGWDWGALLIVFFASSSVLSHYKARNKATLEKQRFAKSSQRDVVQVLANGGIAALLSAFYALLGQPPLLYISYIGVLATVTADTWATELGVLSSSPPRLITSWKVVGAGTSGGITLVGSTAAALGALTIGLAAVIFSPFRSEPSLALFASSWWLPAIALIAGMGGAFADSLLGATVQAMYTHPDGTETERSHSPSGAPYIHLKGWRHMNNDLVNLLSSIMGGIVAIALL